MKKSYGQKNFTPTDIARLPPLAARLLEQRGITNPADIERFINPDYERDINDPFLMHDMERAVGRILRAIDQNELIMIYADYDADGIPGAVVLSDFFKKIGYENFGVYIPHRHDEGYGLHMDAITQFITDGVKLIITIDLGITAVAEIAYAKENGIDTIVTDHHEPAEILPEAVAIVNPKLGSYPDRMLCGAATIWKVVCGMLETMRSSDELSKKYLETVQVGWEKWLLDMVGIATLSDMVPLLAENRALAHFGLRVLKKTKRIGLSVLFKKLKMNQQQVTEDDITFMLTPKLNAASRMAHPMDAFKVLATDDELEAHMMTAHLLDLNTKRKLLVAQTMKEVKHKLADRELGSIIVVGSPDWQAGILGLVASKITDEYNRPAFVWSREGESIKGSCRSDGTCNVVSLMTSVEKNFVQFGGHKEAGGFTMLLNQIHHLEEHLIEAYGTLGDTKDMVALSADIEISIDDAHTLTCRAIGLLAPYGIGHPKPVLRFANVLVDTVGQFGKGHEHLKVSFRNSKGHVLEGIAFYTTSDNCTKKPVSQERVTILGHLEESFFRGRGEVRLRIIDII